MVAGPLIAQGAVDDDKVGRRSGWSDLPGRGQAHQQLAAAREQLFRDEDSERRAYRAADDTDGLVPERKRIEPRVVARPALEDLRLAGLPETAHDVAVRIENADRWDVGRFKAFLAPGLAQ
jgi:hypothetical protein